MLKIMKYSLMLLITLLSIMGTVGCSSDSKPNIPYGAFTIPSSNYVQKVEIIDAFCIDTQSSQFPFSFTLKNLINEHIETSYYWALNDPKADSPQYQGQGNASLPALGTKGVEIQIKEIREYDPRFYVMYVHVYQGDTQVGFYRDQKSTYDWDYSVNPPKPLTAGAGLEEGRDVATLRISLSGSEDVAALNIIDNAKELGWDAKVSGSGEWTTPENEYISRDSYRLQKGSIIIDIFPIDKSRGLGAPLDQPLIEIYLPNISSLSDLPAKEEGEMANVLLNIGIIDHFSLENVTAEGDAENMAELIDFQSKWEELCEKVNQQGYSSLSDEEKVWFTVEILISDIDNGGFVSYFYNIDGEYAQAALESLKTIGATNTRELLKRVMDLFPDGNPPIDIEERNEIINSWDVNKSEAIAVLDEVDDVFFNQEENVELLLVKYIQRNKLNI